MELTPNRVGLEAYQGITLSQQEESSRYHFSMPLVFDSLSEQTAFNREQAIFLDFSEHSHIVNKLRTNCYEYVENTDWRESTRLIMENLIVNPVSRISFDKIVHTEDDKFGIELQPWSIALGVEPV